MTIKKKRRKGVNVTVSPKAHRIMRKKVVMSDKKLDLRGHINILNGLSPEE